MNSQGAELAGSLLACHTALELQIRIFGSPLRYSVVDCDRSELLRFGTVLKKSPLPTAAFSHSAIFPEKALPGVIGTVYHRERAAAAAAGDLDAAVRGVTGGAGRS